MTTYLGPFSLSFAFAEVNVQKCWIETVGSDSDTRDFNDFELPQVQFVKYPPDGITFLKCSKGLNGWGLEFRYENFDQINDMSRIAKVRYVDDKQRQVECDISFSFNGDEKLHLGEGLSGFDCVVCKTGFDEQNRIPKVLSCGHTVCAQCLTRFEQNALAASGSFRCSLCRAEFHCGTFKHTTNYALMALLQARKDEQREKNQLMPNLVDDPDHPCIENEKHESDLYCLVCKETFCTWCFNLAHNTNRLSTHKKVPVSQIPVSTLYCPAHKKKQAKFVCPRKECSSAQNYFCLECRNENHPTHKYRTIKAISVENTKTLVQSIEELRNMEIAMTSDLAQILEYANSYHVDGDFMKEAKRKIESEFEEKKEEAITKLEEWAKGQKEQIEAKWVELAGKKETVVVTRREKKKCLKRKIDLHLKEVSNIAQAVKEFDTVREETRKVRKIDELTFDYSMTTLPFPTGD